MVPLRRPFPPALARAASLVAPATLFLLLSAAFLWQPLLTGRVFLPTGMGSWVDPVWLPERAALSDDLPQNVLLGDVAEYYYPYADYAIARLRTGAFPLWNPYILAGTPFFASVQAAVLDPINLLTYQAGPHASWLWAAWLRLAIIGFATYGFLRALGRSSVAGIGAGVVFMLCGFVTAWLNYSVVTSLTWLPAAFWSTTLLLRSGRAVWLATTALVLGAMLVGGHPETQFLIGVAWGLYGLFTLGVACGRDAAALPARRGIALLAAAGALGLGLAAVQLLPFVDFLLGSSALSARLRPVQAFDLRETLIRLAVIFFPNFTGSPILGNTYWARFTNFAEQASYIGLLATALAVVGALSWARRDRYVRFFAGLALLGVWLAIRAPGSQIVMALPLLNVGHGVRWAIVWSFAGAVLVGYALDALLALRPEGSALKRIGLGLAAAAALAASALVVLCAGVALAGWDRAWRATLPHATMVQLFQPTNLALSGPVLFLAAGAAVLLARWRRWLGATTTAALLVGLLYADLWSFGSTYNSTTPVEAIYPPSETTRFLTAHLGHERFVGASNVLRPNVPMLFRLRDLRGYEDVIDAPFMLLYGSLLRDLWQDDFFASPSSHRLLQAAGVRYVVAPRDPAKAVDPALYRWLLDDRLVSLYEVRAALPRAYVVFGASVLPDLPTSISALLDPAHDPSRSVVLTGQGVPLRAPDGALQVPPVSWRQDDPERIELEVELPAPGYLVLSDTYAPGWQALVDGQPAPLLRGNVVFRAVPVPAGRHTVAFSYWPPLLTPGLVLSGLVAAVSAALLGSAALTAWRERRVALGGQRPPVVSAPARSAGSGAPEESLAGSGGDGQGRCGRSAAAVNRIDTLAERPGSPGATILNSSGARRRATGPER